MDIEVQEVRRAVLTQVVWHRRERRKWLAIADDEAETVKVSITARANAKAHRIAIKSLRYVLEDVRTAARARDRAWLTPKGAAGMRAPAAPKP